MPREEQAVSMGMRFTLYERADGGDFKRMAVPGFSAWTRSQDDVAGLLFDRHVNQLAPATAYRVVVDFAWYDDAGRTVDKARRTSRTCPEGATSA